MFDFSIVAGTSKILNIDVATTLDLTTASDVIWSARECCEDAPFLTKSVIGGGVTVVSPQKIRVTLAPADTVGKSGSYMHGGLVIGAAGAVYAIRQDDDSLGEMKIIK